MPERIKHYIHVTKPGIVSGNLIAAAGGFFLASRGRVDAFLLLSTLTGISLVVASGCVFNNCVDRDIDRKMDRTRNRVIVAGLMSIKAAVVYASVLGIAGAALLCVAANPLSVAVVLTGFGVYVGVYSLYMKRRSIYGTWIGSLAGAAPPLAGYCAVSNRFDMGALILLIIFTFWQMPHCYAIAIYRLEDYAAAEIPVVPVRRGTAAAGRQIIVYIIAFTAAALMLTPAGYAGYGTFVIAALLGLSWLHMAWPRPRPSDERRWAGKLYVFSILTIVVLCIMMSIDFMAPAGSAMLQGKF